MALKDTDTFLVTNGFVSFQVEARYLLNNNNVSGMNALVNEGANSFRCPVGQLEKKNYKNEDGVDRILLVQRDGESFQVTLKELLEKYGNYADPGQEIHNDSNTVGEWTVPDGVRSISVIAVGAGGGGANSSPLSGGGGGGGALAFRNYIAVKPGDVFKLYAGESGTGASHDEGGNARDGGDSGIYQVSSSSWVVIAGGGGGAKGEEGGKAGVGSSVQGQTRIKGGRGGDMVFANNRYDHPGAGGAPGTYVVGKWGPRGQDGDGDNRGVLPAANSGGAAGGATDRNEASGGGGIGVTGKGATASANNKGGSGGADADGMDGGNYGGGGGGYGKDSDTATRGGDGGRGAVCISWPATASFP